MFHQVQQAVMPRLPMDQAIGRWHEIANRLSAPWRKRRPQVETIMGCHDACPGKTQQ
jgi:hypothetical protein